MQVTQLQGGPKLLKYLIMYIFGYNHPQSLSLACALMSGMRIPILITVKCGHNNLILSNKHGNKVTVIQFGSQRPLS